MTILRNALAIGLTLAVGSAQAAPFARGATQFDGRWSVEVVTEQGVCDRAYRYRAVIERGEIHDTDDDTITITGRVETSGTIKGRIVRGPARAEVAGRLVGRSGSGTWTTSTFSGCSGRWNAERRA